LLVKNILAIKFYLLLIGRKKLKVYVRG
jgi:hypothetical protein